MRDGGGRNEEKGREGKSKEDGREEEGKKGIEERRREMQRREEKRREERDGKRMANVGLPQREKKKNTAKKTDTLEFFWSPVKTKISVSGKPRKEIYI